MSESAMLKALDELTLDRWGFAVTDYGERRAYLFLATRLHQGRTVDRRLQAVLAQATPEERRRLEALRKEQRSGRA